MGFQIRTVQLGPAGALFLLASFFRAAKVVKVLKRDGYQGLHISPLYKTCPQFMSISGKAYLIEASK